MKQGKLIILEGLDGCGKDTQADILVQKHRAKKCRLPDYTVFWGQEIYNHIHKTKKQWITEEEFQMLMAQNYIYTLREKIMPAIKEWKNIVLTRFTPSMRAYSRAFSDNYGFFQKIAEGIEEIFHDAIDDITVFYLKIPLEKSLQRIEERDRSGDQAKVEVFENREVLEKVFIGYEVSEWINYIIDGTLWIYEVQDKILELAKLSQPKKYQ